jgi:hypothetical protein
LPYVKSPEDTWREIISAVAPQLHHVSAIEFPRVSGVVVSRLLAALPQGKGQLKSISAVALHPRDIDLSDMQEYIKGVEEIKLKAAAGRLKIIGGNGIGALMPLRDSLQKLVSLQKMHENN